MDIIEYTQTHIRVCTGKEQGINMEFFVVQVIGNPNKEEFIKLMNQHKGDHCACDFNDKEEHSYIEIGGWIGDQGIALWFMALGSHLGVFNLMTPSGILPELGKELHAQMAGAGYITVKMVP